MENKDLARFFSKYWIDRGPNDVQLIDNAPAELRQFVNQLSLQTDRAMIKSAFASLAGEGRPNTPETVEILNWLVAYPHAMRHTDLLLAAKRPPKTFDDLMAKVYRAEQFATIDLVSAFLTEELEKG